MTSRGFPYDPALDPPGPVVPMRVSTPLGAAAVVVPALVDTGADCTIVPLRVARRLPLPKVRQARLIGVTGAERFAPVVAANVEVAGESVLVPVVAFGLEAIIGRDLLNRWLIELDGRRTKIGSRRTRRARGSKRG